MSQVAALPELPPAVRHVLQRVRRGVRTYIWLYGLAVLVATSGIAFWVGLALDWTFEPSPALRRVGLMVVAVAVLAVLYRYLLCRVWVRLPDSSLALLLERRFDQLNDHLVTAVDLATAESSADGNHPYNPVLVSRSRQAAEVAAQSVDPARVFDRRPLARVLLAAAGLAVPILAFWLLAGEAFSFWIERIRLSPEPWPRRVQLEVVGFPLDSEGRRVEKIAQDDDYELVVRANARDYEVPQEVEIRFRREDGRRGRDTMIRVGDSVPGRDDFQPFRYTFEDQSADMTLDVVGGDDRVSDLHLQIVQRPELLSMEVACEYPAYLARPPRRLAVTGGMRIPSGSRLTLSATSTKPLTEARIHALGEGREDVLSFAEQPSDRLLWEYGTLTADEVLLVDATDIDGVDCRNPYRVSLSVVPDELPQVAVRLAGIGTAITPEAVIPLAGIITDDYGLDSVWFAYQVDGGPVQRRAFWQQPDGQTEFGDLDNFDTHWVDPQTGQRPLELQPGQTLTLAVHATDRFDLADVPRVGMSQRFTLDVVTVAELLALLERRELSLRQRYEAIIEKVTDTRNLLTRVEFVPPTETDATDEVSADDEPAPTAEESAGPALARRRLRVAGSLQNITQASNEILGIAAAFDDIYQQLVNNRIDNADLKKRLNDDIAQPLHKLGESRLPELESRLQDVELHVEDPQAAEPALAASITLADEILVEMQQVLERMLELETYNEVVSLLRELISDQEELNRKTKERQKNRLQNLLEE